MKTAKILVSGAFVILALIVTVNPVFAASLSLSPATANKNVGDTFNVDIVLDTEGAAVSGATAIIDYDTDLLAVVDGDSNASGVNIKPSGQYLTQVLTNTVNASTGQIRYDAGILASTYTGRGVIATISFEAQSVGAAQAAFVFSQTSTTNTSAVAAATGPTNLLTKINDGNYNIGESGGSDDDDDTLLQTGVLENTIALVLGGFAFIGAGLAFAKKAFL